MFRLGTRSKRELVGVHPDLVKVVEEAILISTQDFSVHDGLRTVADQRRLVKRGASQTMNSKHLPQADGFGYAVDLVPYINGKMRWEWEPIYEIANSVRMAAHEFDVKVRWGGCWKLLNGTLRAPEKMVDDYGKRRRAQGRKAFTDGPHFELAR